MYFILEIFLYLGYFSQSRNTYIPRSDGRELEFNGKKIPTNPSKNLIDHKSTFPNLMMQSQLEKYLLYNMAVRVVEFLNGGTKLERFLNQHTSRKLLIFDN